MSKKVFYPTAEREEQFVLGACLCHFEALNEACQVLDHAAFVVPAHIEIFRNLRALYVKDAKVDKESLAHHMKSNDSIKKLEGGYNYLQGLALEGRGVDYEYYIKVLDEKRQLRSLMAISEQTISKCGSANADPLQIYEETQRSLSLISSYKHGECVTLDDVLQGRTRPDGKSIIKLMEEIRERRRLGLTTLPGLSTGWEALDETIGGLVPSQLVIVGARPGVGKSTFVINIMRHLCVKEKIPVLFFSLEMSKLEVTQKLLALEADCSFASIRDASVSENDLEHFVYPAIKNLSDSTLLIQDQENMQISSLMTVATRAADTKKIQAIFVDYLGYIHCAQYRDNKVEQISYISACLKGLAKRLNIPVVVISQLSRAHTHTGKEPTMADLRDSGQIEANADAVILLHRQPELTGQHGSILEIIVDKNRFGPKQKFSAAFDGRTGRITGMMTRAQASVATRAIGGTLE